MPYCYQSQKLQAKRRQALTADLERRRVEALEAIAMACNPTFKPRIKVRHEERGLIDLLAREGLMLTSQSDG